MYKQAENEIRITKLVIFTWIIDLNMKKKNLKRKCKTLSKLCWILFKVTLPHTQKVENIIEKTGKYTDKSQYFKSFKMTPFPQLNDKPKAPGEYSFDACKHEEITF